MKSENYRFYIQIRSEHGIDYKDTFQELKTVRPDKVPSIKNSFNWF